MRLIDADELMEHVWRDKLDSRELIAAMIENAPTVKEIKPSVPQDFIEKMVACALGYGWRYQDDDNSTDSCKE